MPSKAKHKMTKFERDALKVVNKIRVACNKGKLVRLPKGTPGERTSCPVANALDGGMVEVDGSTITVPLDMAQDFLAVLETEHEVSVPFKAPAAISRFVGWFDSQQAEAAIELAE